MPNPKKPIKLKIIQGTVNSTRDLNNSMDPSELAQIPECPEELQILKRGVSIWNDSTQDLFNLGMLHASDLQQLMAYCVEMCRYWECQDKINEDQSLVKEIKDNKGNTIKLVQSPYVAMSQKHITTARTIAKEFGFSPSARSGISMPSRPTGPVDPMTALIEKYK